MKRGRNSNFFLELELKLRQYWITKVSACISINIKEVKVEPKTISVKYVEFLSI